MACQIKNRCFNLMSASSLNGDAPKFWTTSKTSTNFTWQSGMWRAVNGGLIPNRGKRCLLIGPGDDATTTLGGGLLDTDTSSAYQSFSASSLISAISADYSCATLYPGGGGITRMRLSDGSTDVDDDDVHTGLAANTKYELRCSTSSLSPAGNWTLTLKLLQTSSYGAAGTAIPRVYFDNVKCWWAPYTQTPIRILRYSDDLACASATSITGTTADTGYDVDYVANRRMAHPYISEAGTSGYIEFDLGSAQNVNIVGVMGTNFDAGDTVTFKGGSSTNPSSISYSLPVNQQHDTPSVSNCNTWAEFTQQSYRYWRLSWTCSSKKVRIGEIVFGRAEHMQRNYQWSPQGTVGYQNQKLVTPYGNEWAYEKFSRRAYSMSLDNLEQEDVEDWRYIMNDAAGDAYPVFIVPDPTDYRCFYGTFQNQFADVEKQLNVYGIGTVSFAEQPIPVVQS